MLPEDDWKHRMSTTASPASGSNAERPQSQNARLTKRLVDSLRPHPGGEYVVWDSDLRGFGIRVYPSGRLAYFVFFRMGGRGSTQSKATIAQHGVMTVEEAREEARHRLHLARTGTNPIAARRERDTALTVEDAWKAFHKEHVTAKRKPKTAADYQGLFDREIEGPLGKKRVGQLTRAEVSAWHAKRTEKPATANRALAVLSSLVSWAEERGYREASAGNPCAKVKKFTETARERFLTEVEMDRLGKALNAAEADGENPRIVNAFRLLLMSGARQGEIRTAKWSWVDLERGTIRLPDSKHKAKTITLPLEGVQVLRRLDELRIKDNPHLIPAAASEKPVNDLEKPWQRIRKRAGLSDVRIHDLRHTFASHLAMGGQSLPIVGALLGHSQPATTARYAHLADNPLRAAVQQFGSKFGAALAGSTDAANSDVSGSATKPKRDQTSGPKATSATAKLEKVRA